MDKELAIRITGGLSKTTKLPCHSYNLPAQECKVGARLVNVPGSVCHSCYAFKGWYPKRPVIQEALYRRLKSIQNRQWVDAMTFLIADTNNRYFRWHDIGDLQSVQHLDNIAKVVANTPHVLHWLPTREYKMVETWLASHTRPINLIIRLSAHMIDGLAPVALAERLNVSVSGVHTTAEPEGFVCRARENGHQCGACRACWQTKVPFVSYPQH